MVRYALTRWCIVRKNDVERSLHVLLLNYNPWPGTIPLIYSNWRKIEWVCSHPSWLSGRHVRTGRDGTEQVDSGWGKA